MPVDPLHTMPKEKIFDPLPADQYTVEVSDVEHEVKANPFKKDGDKQPDEMRQYKFTFLVLDDGEFRGREILAWIKESLITSSKAKNPGLPEFLNAVTGEVFTPNDNEKVNGNFINSLIGSQVRVQTKVQPSKDGTKQFTKVVSYLPVKKKLKPSKE